MKPRAAGSWLLVVRGQSAAGNAFRETPQATSNQQPATNV
jgi:hypothetical protein